MEESIGELVLTEAEAKCIAKGRKPLLTRLQTQAPPCLQLDLITTTTVTSDESFSFSPSVIDSSKAIPLLSPLVLSPNSNEDDGDKDDKERIIGGESSVVVDDDKDQRQHDEVVEDDVVSTGWQHPAVAPFADPSSLIGFFKSQCIITNQAQS